jgi:hypothetical protein
MSQQLSLRSLTLSLLYLFIAIGIPRSSGQETDQPSPTNVSPGDNATTTVDFASALLVAASVAPEMALANMSNPIPIPSDAPDYDRIRQLADRWPALQETSVSVQDPEVVLAESSPPPNGTQDLGRRQGSRRVLIVGDSMTHCNEGDYTWRYRISQWFRAQSISVDFVGPYEGTAQSDEPSAPGPPPLYGSAAPQYSLRTSGGYAAPFDRYSLVTPVLG